MALWPRLVVVLAVVSTLATVPVGAGSQADFTTSSATTELDSSDVVISVRLHDDGSATWSVEHRYRLSDDNTTEAFESLQRDVEANRSAYTTRFETRMRDTVRTAENATGREMAVENVTVTAEKSHLPQEYGVVTYRFEWEGFAVVDGGRIAAGDALAGFFLDSETRLLISWPSEHSLRSVSPSPDERRDGTVVWFGPTDFGPDEPAVVVTDGTGPSSILSALDERTVGTALVAVFVVGAVGWGLRTWSRRGSGVPWPGSGGETTERPADDADSDADPEGDQSPPMELLSNEEQVLRVLEDHGGRVKQQEVVQTLGWTDAKTSQVVGDLRESGKVESFRLGRENVLVFPDDREEIES